ncbi:MAG: 50S ribosomal protein L10 [Isosphaeraceae bacterium]
MSKYVKELMMDQLAADLGETRSVLILDLKGLDGVSENRLRLDLRKKKIRMRSLKNTLARRVFTDHGMKDLSQYLEGPSVAVWGGDGIAELAKEISEQVKKLKTPEIKGGAVDGVVVGPSQVEEITKLPSREVLIGQLLGLALGAPRELLALAGAPASTLMGQLEALVERLGGDPGSAETAEAGTPAAEGAAEPTEAAAAEPTEGAAAEAPPSA